MVLQRGDFDCGLDCIFRTYTLPMQCRALDIILIEVVMMDMTNLNVMF